MVKIQYLISSILRLQIEAFYGFEMICLVPLFLAFVPHNLSSQTDTIHLKEVLVVGRVSASADFGQVTIDSLNLMSSANIGEVLSRESILFLRENGPGLSSTVSFRGMSSKHTELVWNGLPISSPTLGQTDISLISPWLFKRIGVSAGPLIHPAAQSIAGTLILSGQEHFTETFELQSGFSQYGRFYSGGGFSTGNEVISNQLKISWKDEKNDVPFDDFAGHGKRLSNADYKSLAVIESFALRPTPSQLMNIDIWFQRTDRGIAPGIHQDESFARQEDESLRTSLRYELRSGQALYRFTGGLQWIKLYYEDPRFRIRSRNESLTLQGLTTVAWKLNPGINSLSAISYSLEDATSTGYRRQQVRQRISLFNRSDFRIWKIDGSYAAKVEIVNGTTMPSMHRLQLSLEKSFLSGWIRADRSQKLPSMDDLYWNPGGNRSLRPEISWSFSGGLEIRRAGSGSAIQLHCYTSIVNDYIQWLPAGSLWAPKNLPRVWARGGGLLLNHTFRGSAISWDYRGGYHLTIATKRDPSFRGDRSVNKQLIFAPKNRISQSLSVNSRQLNLELRYSFNGKVYTASDGSSSHQAYHLVDVHFGYRNKWSDFDWTLYLKAMNITDSHYLSISNRPMPGRYFGIGLDLGVRKNKK